MNFFIFIRCESFQSQEMQIFFDRKILSPGFGCGFFGIWLGVETHRVGFIATKHWHNLRVIWRNCLPTTKKLPRKTPGKSTGQRRRNGFVKENHQVFAVTTWPSTVAIYIYIGDEFLPSYAQFLAAIFRWGKKNSFWNIWTCLVPLASIAHGCGVSILYLFARICVELVPHFLGVKCHYPFFMSCWGRCKLSLWKG